jgi:LysR family transcriptional regulator, glycine cleavage system transcriptional activator
MPSRLPSLHALQVFEVAARHQNFSRAAVELALTQGAVSYQIRTLEADLGFALFNRIGRSVILTPQGSSLWPVVSSGFGQIAETVDRLKRESRQHPSEVVVAATTYFASRWLLRRLAHFMSEHPDIGVRIPYAPSAGDTAPETRLQIKFGDGRWPGIRAIRLFESELVGLCSPALLGGRTPPLKPEDLGDVPYLHDDGVIEAEAWRKWQDAAGVRQPTRMAGSAIVDPNVRMQAAIDGQGMVLADRLMDDELRAGRLVAPFSVILRGYSYYLLIHQTGALSRADALFVEWLEREALNP